MKPYQLFLRREAMEALRLIPREQQRRLAHFLDLLAANPFQAGDYSERDATHREIQIRVIGKNAVTFWTEHAVKEIKIIAITKAD